MREEGRHHDLRLGWEVEIACVGVWDDEWVVARGARDKRGGREDAKRFLENSVYYIQHSVSVGKDCGKVMRNARYPIVLRSA